QLPGRAIDGAQRLGQHGKPLHGAVRDLDRISRGLGPEADLLQLLDQVAVDLQEVAGERLALEEVRDLRLDAFVAAGDRGDGGRGRDGDEEAVAQAVRL